MKGRLFWGPVLGIAAFLAGAGLIAWCFKLALDIFRKPPSVVLDVKPEASLNLNQIVQNLSQSLLQAIVLVVLAIIGSLICNAGIRLYAHSAGRRSAETKEAPKA